MGFSRRCPCRRPRAEPIEKSAAPAAPPKEKPSMSTVDVKPTSNRKPGGKADAPNEPFKRALASCTRALARHPELEIAFSTDKPALDDRAGRGQGAAAGAAAQAQSARGGDHPRASPIRSRLRLACHSDADPSPARAAESGGALAVRRGRAGAGRGDRLAPDGGRRRRTSPRCSTTAITAAPSPRRAAATRRRSRTRSRCWRASA